MTAHTLTIEITPDGEIKSTVHGIAGPDCSKISEWIDSLGNVTKDEKTLDWNKPKDAELKIIRR
jgi:hypothetical protein